MVEIERYLLAPNFGKAQMVADPEGDFVRFSDHEQALAEKDREIKRLERERDMARGQEGLDPFIGDDGELYTPATPREQMFLALALEAKERADQAHQQERQRIREGLLEPEAVKAGADGAAYLDPDLSLAEAELRSQRTLEAALDSLGDGESSEEIVAVEGTVTFQRSEGECADECLCCNGPHVFSRYIDVEPEPSRYPGLTKESFDQWISEALLDNRLEGRRVRVSMHLLADPSTREEAG